MTTQISGNTGVSQCQPGSVSQDDLAANVVGKGPVFHATQSGSQSVSVGVLTEIVINVEVIDTNACFNPATGRFTPNVAGYYQLNATALANAVSVGGIEVAILKNAASIGAVSGFNNVAQSMVPGLTTSGITYLNGTTDYVSLFAACQGGASSWVVTGCSFSGFLARAA